MLSVYKTDTATVYPCNKLNGTLKVPGDKSISHRVGMLASIGSGISRVYGFLNSADCIGLLKAMEALGARSHRSRDGELYIHGTGGRILSPAGAVDLGNSGTAMRLLTGLLAGFDKPITLTGDASLRMRPMRRIADPLTEMGADVKLSPSGCAPLTVQGGALKAIDYEVPVASAQVKSCVMLAALFAEGTTRITEPAPTRDHTEQLFRQLGLPVSVDGVTISVDGLGPTGPAIEARKWVIPGDISSAAFWMIAAAAHRRGSVVLKGVGLNPRRTAVIDVLKRMGARIKVVPQKSDDGYEPRGEIRLHASKLKGTVIEGAEIPNLIDEIPILAVAGALAEGETIIKDARELRVKESDRIETMCANLRAMNVEVEEMEDGMRISGPASVQSRVAVDSFGDHRVAMAMAVLALFSDTPLTIKRVDCIETSYPGFWDHLRQLGGHVE